MLLARMLLGRARRALPTLMLAAASCGGDGPATPTGPSPDYRWTSVAPHGGFVSAVAFHPTRPDELWASGDDGSGLYRSTDGGASWQLVTSTPPDMSAYRLLFDPADPRRLYAPNHFGRGLLATEDGGEHWSVLGAGLPSTGEDKRVYDLAIDPSSPEVLYAATAGGLFRSSDHGTSFAPVSSPAFGAERSFTAVAMAPGGRLCAGTENGRVYTSADGTSFSEITTADSAVVSSLALTPNALYIGLNGGFILKSESLAPADLVLLNDPLSGGPIGSGMWTKLAAVSGATAGEDRLYVGTVYLDGDDRWGFFESADGGQSFTRRIDGLEGSSAFNLAVDPGDPNALLLGTINSGIYLSGDGGRHWAAASEGLRCTDSFAFTEGAVPEHLWMSSTAGLRGTSKVFGSVDDGQSWHELPALADVDVEALYVDPRDEQRILVGSFHQGLLGSNAGEGGPFEPRFAATVGFNRIAADPTNPDTLYATSNAGDADPNALGEHGVYVSTDGGQSWEQRLAAPVAGLFLMVAPHPSHPGEAVAVGADIVATTDSFASSPTPLGLTAAFPGEVFMSAAFDPTEPGTLLVGAADAKLFRAEGYGPAGVASWSEVALPAAGVFITDVVATARGHWYAAAFIGDVLVEPGATPGLLRSTDRGASWSFLEQGLFPARLVWRFGASRKAGRYYAGMWGGGFMRLDDD